MYCVMSTLAFKDWLRQQREAAGLSMGELGEDLDMSRGHINNLEKGRFLPSDDSIPAIAERFKVARAWLQAQVDAERLGDERLLALDQHVLPEVRARAQGVKLGVNQQNEIAKLDVPAASKAPAKRIDYRALIGPDAPVLTAVEKAIVKELYALTDGELWKVDLDPESPAWTRVAERENTLKGILERRRKSTPGQEKRA